MPEKNIIKTPDMGVARDIDFVERFSFSLVKLTEALGITRPLPLKQGNKIQTYKYEITTADGEAANGIVGEGEEIPLTHVKRVPDREIKVGFRKYRKAVTMEEVHRIGYDAAVTKSDSKVLGMMQKNIRTDFFEFLATAPTKLKAESLQGAFGKAWGKLNTIFEDYGEFQIVQFINPEDAGDYLGEAVIANGQSVGFGLTLLKDFTGAGIVLTNASVPRGKVYSTAVDNINLMYIDVNGESSKTFEGLPLVTDELGLIALVKQADAKTATTGSTLYNGITLFAEITNGVVETTIEKQVAAEKMMAPYMEPVNEEKTTLDLLKEEADELGIGYSNNIGEEKLRQRIEDFKKENEGEKE
jgi:hypothetical protein